MMSSAYNLRSSAVKRLMKEAEEMRNPTYLFFAQPLEDNLFEWHFTIRGPKDSDFQKGFYHGRIVIPTDYPMKPPNIILLTPNGRFETNKKICLSISGYHPETWQPSWSIRTALLAIIGFMPTHGAGSIGSLDYTPEERKKLALRSNNWVCNECGKIRQILLEIDDEANNNDQEEAKRLATEYTIKGEEKNDSTISNNKESPEILEKKMHSEHLDKSDQLIKQVESLLSKMTEKSPSKEILVRRLASLKKLAAETNVPLYSNVINPENNFGVSNLIGKQGDTFNNSLSNQQVNNQLFDSKQLQQNPKTQSENTAVPQQRLLPNAINLPQQQTTTLPDDYLFSRRYIWSNLAILCIGLFLVFLIGRRVYLANVWRFYSAGPSHDEEL